MPLSNSILTRSHNWIDDRDNTIKITAVRHDAEDDNIVSAINEIMAGTAGFIGATLHYAGTVSLPGMAFNGDTNTGFYRIAADTIGVAVSGTLALRIGTTHVRFSKMAQLAKGTDVDDDDVDGSNILTLPTDGNTFDFGGTQQLDAIATTGKVGTPILLIHTSIRQLTQDATDLILLSGANITTAAGDVSEWVEYIAAGWRMTNYERADGTPLVSSTASNVALLDTENQALTGGFTITPKDIGTVSSGTTTPDPGDCPQQKMVNGGASDIAASSVLGSTIVSVTNNGSAGALSNSGFDQVYAWGLLTTTDTETFDLLIQITTAGARIEVVPVA